MFIDYETDTPPCILVITTKLTNARFTFLPARQGVTNIHLRK